MPDAPVVVTKCSCCWSLAGWGLLASVLQKAAATPGPLALLMMLLLMLVCQSDDKNEGVKNIDDGEEGSYYVPAAAVLAGSDAGITGESRRLIATGAA